MTMVQARGNAEEDERAELMQDSQLLINYRGSAWVGEDLETLTALATYLRAFRGVHKQYLHPYVATDVHR
jgi:hypothetical protein